jgi:hypothetical protein
VKADALHCRRCREIIGIYEPMIVQVGEQIRETSRAADESSPIEGAAHYHRDCHAATAEEVRR